MTELEKMNAICFALIHACRETNAEEMTLTQSGVHHKGEQLGDWEIIVRRKKAAKRTPITKEEKGI